MLSENGIDEKINCKLCLVKSIFWREMSLRDATCGIHMKIITVSLSLLPLEKNELDELKLMQNILTAANILSYILSLDNMLLFRLKFFPDEFINVIAGLMHLLQDRSRKIWNCLHASAYVAFTSGLWLTGHLKRAYRVLVFSLCWK